MAPDDGGTVVDVMAGGEDVVAVETRAELVEDFDVWILLNTPPDDNKVGDVLFAGILELLTAVVGPVADADADADAGDAVGVEEDAAGGDDADVDDEDEVESMAECVMATDDGVGVCVGTGVCCDADGISVDNVTPTELKTLNIDVGLKAGPSFSELLSTFGIRIVNLKQARRISIPRRIREHGINAIKSIR